MAGVLDEEIKRQEEEQETAVKEQAEADRRSAELRSKETEADDDDDDDEDEKPAPAKRASKKDRHRARYDELARAKEAAEAEAATLRTQIASFQARAAAPQPEVTRRSEDPKDREIASLWSRQQEMSTRIQSAQDKGEIGKLLEDWRELNDQRTEMIAERAYRRSRPSADDEQIEIERRLLKSEFPEVYRDPVVSARAVAIHKYLVHRTREPDDIATARKAAERALAELGITRRSTSPAPTATQTQRYGAVSAQAGSNGSSGPREPALSDDQKLLARSFYKDLPDDKAYRKFEKMLKARGVM